MGTLVRRYATKMEVIGRQRTAAKMQECRWLLCCIGCCLRCPTEFNVILFRHNQTEQAST
jgi:hypothetical protein